MNLESSISTFQKPSPDSFKQTDGSDFSSVKSQTSAQAAGFDTQAYDGTDSMSNRFETLNFAKPLFYDTSSQSPVLQKPELESQQNSQPYTKNEQLIIKQAFSSQVQALLSDENLRPDEREAIGVALMTDGQVEDPRLTPLAQTIKKKVNAQISQQARLPSSWSMQSKNAKEWTPEKLEPYSDEKKGEINQFYDNNLKNLAQQAETEEPPLSPDQLADLKTAFSTGQVSSSVATVYVKLTQLATKATQENFGLSPSWYKGTEVEQDWKPLEFSLVNPTSLAAVRSQEITGNIISLVENSQTAAKSVAKSLKNGSPGSASMLDFLQTIGKAIQELKHMLEEISIKDAQLANKATQGKTDELKQKRQIMIDQEHKTNSMNAKQAKAQKMSKTMKILGPILSAVMTVIATILTVLTAGACLPLLIATVAVGVIMTAYSVADSVTGVTQKIATAVKEEIDKNMATASPTEKLLAKIAIVAAVVIVMAIILVACIATGQVGGAAEVGIVAAEGATQTASQIAVQATAATIKELMTQAIILTVMSSNVIPESMGAIFANFFKNPQQKAIFEAAVMALTIIMITVAVAAKGKPNVNQADEAVNETSAAAKSSSQKLENLSDESKKLVDQAADRANEGASSVKSEDLSSVVEGDSTLTNYFRSIKEMATSGNVGKLRLAARALESGNQAVQISNNIFQGVTSLAIAQYLKQTGDDQAAIQTLMTMIKLLEKMMKNIQTGLSDNASFITELQNAYNSIYTSAGASGSKLASSILG